MTVNKATYKFGIVATVLLLYGLNSEGGAWLSFASDSPAKKLNSICEDLQKPFDLKNRSPHTINYFVDDSDLRQSGEMLAFARVPAEGKGRVVQSVAFEHATCSTLAFSSLRGKPERLKLWRFDSDGRVRGSLLTTQFGHGQDLSRQIGSKGQEWFWVTDETGKGARRFRMSPDKNDFKIAEMQHFLLAQIPLTSHNVSISADGKHLIRLGRESKELGRRFIVYIYDLEDVLHKAGSKNTGAIKINLKPKFQWYLNALQHRKVQWRQGIAGLGNSIFVLTGNGNPAEDKYLVTYSLSGETIAKQLVLLGRDTALREGEHYEPEGLEIVKMQNEPYLGIGIASGKKGARNYRVWGAPLKTN